MKKFLLTVLSSLSLTVFSQESIQLASDVWPPFTNVEGQKTIALDLVETAFFRMNEPMSVQITEFQKVLKGIEEGQFAGCGAMWKTPEREKTMLFSEPYLQNRLVLVELKTPQDKLINEPKKIGVVNSYAYDIDLLKADDVEVVFSNTEQENFKKLLNHQVDIMLVDELLIQYLMIAQKEQVDEQLSISSPIAVKSLHLAVRKDNPQAESIIERFNTEIDEMVADGTYNKVLELNWIVADADGDGQLEYVFNGQNAGQNPPESSYTLFHYDSSSTASNSYRVNGTLYENWEDVPPQYKQNLNPDPAKGNMIIRF